ncbi:hypothetical protein MOV66_05225 [Agrobacterium sp. SHOUNA12C]|uniref:hypothetical protein n=1 Tax=Rhizobium rhizogenes TaxID=359 RepID=UPI0015723591|nr:hypothetical protein [Rhizobium rhizogenes]MCJ9721404.1 hypothetical protein [Agrobacterium sp. BETTINA12B]MCJ9756034.1 hypothetical protein [Agrobacterium sp. SHOUNA12C]NTF64703.1 hypothetical protein [Rhizobium rhizogenes]NTG96051.1 hypothetical protein [Rhizobium rhizogenes]NTI37968.1 hypothetical protein [Rhizobium rhizogenes]
MTRAGSHGEQVALRDVAVRRAALAGAGCGARWLSEIDADLLRRLDATPRLQSRLFHARAEIGGDPACLPVEAGHLLTLLPQMQRKAALSAGLTCHLAAVGPVLSKDKVAALTAIFGDDVLAFAFGHTHLSPPAPVLLGFEDEEVRRLVEADGWAILGLWLADSGLAPIWLGDWESRRDGGSISLIRSAALSIGKAVAIVQWESRR